MAKKSISAVLITGALAAAALLPGAAIAAPTAGDVKSASKECRVERGTTPESRAAFKVKYGTNARGANAFGKCVSSGARKRAAARRTATKSCLTERGRTAESRAAFKAKYAGNNPLKVCVAALLHPVTPS